MYMWCVLRVCLRALYWAQLSVLHCLQAFTFLNLCNCVFTAEIDACLVDNGGCDKNALCMKTGPNRVCVTNYSQCLTTSVNVKKWTLKCCVLHLLQVACACKPGFTSIGHRCFAVNPCRKVTDFKDSIMANYFKSIRYFCMQ